MAVSIDVSTGGEETMEEVLTDGKGHRATKGSNRQEDTTGDSNQMWWRTKLCGCDQVC